MVRVVLATVAATVAAKDDVILLQMRSLSTLEAGTEDQALNSMAASMKEVLLAAPDVMNRASTSNFVKGMQDEITAMKGALTNQNAEDNAEVGVLVAAVNKCNSDKRDSWAGVESKWSGVDGNIDTHRTCRQAEAGLIDDENLKCESKRTTGDQYKNALKNCLTTAATAEQIAACLDGTCADETDLSAKVTACAEAVASTDLKASECQGAQGTLESAFCVAVDHEASVCATQTTCYDAADVAYKNKQNAWNGKLVSQNAMWTSIGHIECLFGLFNQGTQVTSGQVDGCLSMPQLNKFTLDYPAPEVKESCDSARTTWAASAYTDLVGVFNDRLRENQEKTAITVEAECVGA